MQLKNRDQLPILLNKLGLKGNGVEIGVQTGNYSRTILKKSKLSKLYSIDSWKYFAPGSYIDIANVCQLKQYYFYLKTIIKLSQFGKRSQIIRKTSKEASNLFQNESLDFVYIDALHTYEGCKKDIELWWPKLKKGGVFAGHDYLNGFIRSSKFGVKKAVDEFVKKNNLKLFITNKTEDYGFPTWYIINYLK